MEQTINLKSLVHAAAASEGEVLHGEQWHPIKAEEAAASDAQDGQLFNSAKERKENTQSQFCKE